MTNALHRRLLALESLDGGDHAKPPPQVVQTTRRMQSLPDCEGMAGRCSECLILLNAAFFKGTAWQH